MNRQDDILAVHRWPDIAGQFTGADILLGNGFSRRFTERFHYASLFEEFLSGLPADGQASFRALGSTNFELLLDSFAHATRVNAAFGVRAPNVAEARDTLRHGLIRAIQQIHPRYNELDTDLLQRVSLALDAFGNVFTLNYDAILYHIIMLARDRHERDPHVRPYNDCFWNKIDDDYLQFMNYQRIQKYKHVYYLHGALFLFRRGHIDVKIRRRDDSPELIDMIREQIEAGAAPLFVSEARPDEKKLAISRSAYLRFALAHLGKPRTRLVIYGTSLSPADDHIVTAIRKGTREAAVALHTGGKEAAVLQRIAGQYRNTLGGLTLTFFDADTLF